MLWFARSTAARRLLAAAVAVSFSGCSFATVQRARPPAEIDDPRVADDCTTSKLAPGADTALAVVGVVANVVLTNTKSSCDPSRSSCNSHYLPPLAAGIAGAVFTGSAIYGYFSTARCRNRVAAADRCASGNESACYKLRPTWSPPAGWRPAGAFLEPAPTAAPAASVAAPRQVGTTMP